MLAAWYLTWQDPAALLLAAGGLGLALWLRSRLPTGCAGCQKSQPSQPVPGQSDRQRDPPAVIIPASQLLRKLR